MAKTTKKGKKENISISLVTMEAPLVMRKARQQGGKGTTKKEQNITTTQGNDDLNSTELLKILTEIKNGNFEFRMPSNKEGLSGEIAATINEIITNNKKLIEQFANAQNNIGKKGSLHHRIVFPEAQGEWRSGVDSLNLLISELVYPIEEMDKVISAVAKGDLTQLTPFKNNNLFQGDLDRISKEAKGLVNQLDLFTSDLSRVVKEVGSEGKLGGQIKTQGIGGVWNDISDAVNRMAVNITDNVRDIENVITGISKGDLSQKITVNAKGEFHKLKNTINTMVDLLNFFSSEVTRMGRERGLEGNIGMQMHLKDFQGIWKDFIIYINQIGSNLILQVRNIAIVTTAVSKGDFTKKITIEARGEVGDLKNTINSMIDQLNCFCSEVSRVSMEIGSEGLLGGQAHVPGVEGRWKDITDSVNMVASNYTNQVRGISKIVTSVSTGNLSQKLSINAKGEVAKLTDTFNEMIETLSIIADQVTNVAREVGVEGKLGGQAKVPEASGNWKKLTENVNLLAENLTTQVRSISEVASAVTKGDLTRNIRVDAKGEVKELKDTINLMITNLRETTLLNLDQDWLKSNLAKFNQMLQGQKDLKTVARRILSELAQVVGAHFGAFYIVAAEEVFPKLKLFASYAYKSEKHIPKEFLFGEGLVGQCALEKERIILSNVPESYVKINSGLGKIPPSNLILLPVLFENNVKAVIELGTLGTFSNTHLDFLGQLTESIGIVVNTIQTNTRTEVLLSQSQSLANALKIQQEELKRTNDELQNKAFLLFKQKDEVETKNKEVEEARRSLEEKAEQLTLTSKYKSEFLANMSHELRTPLNSLLILAQQLYENPEGNLNDKQTRYAKTIHSCGDDLLELINDILDLSKIESGFITANISNILFSEISTFVETTFKPLSETKNLKFKTEIYPGLPESIDTDSQRLNQILKNLLSNAFKFTERGEVKLKIFNAEKKWQHGNNSLSNAKQVVAFSIIDSGIGISPDKQTIIFEAFQQAEGSTSRKYGGTGLGLSISRGLAELLGGTIELESELGVGSTFTLYLPMDTVDAPFVENDFKTLLPKNIELEGVFDAINMTENEILSKKLEDISEMTNEAGDDRNNISANDKVVLVIEDDLIFGKIMVEHARLSGLKAVVASSYVEIFNFVTRFTPMAITLDVYLSDTSGWKVLDQFKNDLHYRHIPIHLISREENKILALKRGAKSFLLKPLLHHQLNELFDEIIKFNSIEIKQLLIVEQDGPEISRMADLFRENSIEITVTSSLEKANELIKQKIFDTIILDHSLLDFSSIDLFRNIQNDKNNPIPIIIYSSNELDKEEIVKMNTVTNNILLKFVNTRERLLEKTLMLLHFDYARLPPEKRKMMENFRTKSDVLTGKKILVVDDDVRNLFALTTVFERFNIDVITAERGMEAISMMNDFNDIEMVLMDIMMPGMDGYETIRKIRREYKNSTLPIIAVTAQAMKGDRQKCIEAGASDYITKPLKIDQLLSLMRMWFHK
ncbi:MAG: response regulator [Bacteroidia bacterium]|nr:response regulator [Bacteroidia bacterium]